MKTALEKIDWAIAQDRTPPLPVNAETINAIFDLADFYASTRNGDQFAETFGEEIQSSHERVMRWAKSLRSGPYTQK